MLRGILASKKIVSYVLKSMHFEAERNIVFIFQYEMLGTPPNFFPLSIQQYYLTFRYTQELMINRSINGKNNRFSPHYSSAFASSSPAPASASAAASSPP